MIGLLGNKGMKGVCLSFLFLFLTFESKASGYSCYVSVNTSESVNSYVNNVRYLGFKIGKCDAIDSVYFVFDGSNFEDELVYIENRLLKPKDFGISYKIVVNESLYRTLNPINGLSTYCFYKKGVPGEIKLCKLDDVQCPKDLTITETMLNRRDIKLSTLNTISPYFDSDSMFLLISDVDNSLNLVNSNDGNLVRKFSSDSVLGSDIYCNLFSNNLQSCQFARLGEIELKKIGRNRVPFYKVSCFNSKIYIGCGLQVQIFLGKDFNYKDDRGEDQTISKGSPFFWQYSILIELDDSLKLQRVYKIDEQTIPSKYNEDYLAGIDYGFDWISDSMICTYSTPNKRKDISTEDPSVSFYKLYNDTFRYAYGSEVSFPRMFEKKEFWCYNVYLQNYEGKVLFNLPAYNSYSIIESQTGKQLGSYQVDKSYVDSSSLQLSQHVQDETGESLDFLVYDALYEGSSRFLYRKGEKVYFIADDEKICLSDIEQFPIVGLDDFDEGNCTITKNHIFWINKEKRGYILYKMRY